MTKTLQAKAHLSKWNGSEWILRTKDDEPAELMRYVDTDDERDMRNACWYSTIEHAERSWQHRHPDK